MNNQTEPLLMEMSVPGRKAYSLPACDVPETPLSELIPAAMLRDEALALPELSEVDVVRHFTRLSQKNYAVDSGFYPLGSCTMKYNPKMNEDAAALEGFTGVHPLAPESATQGCLQLMYDMDRFLCALTGMDRMTLQPAAGAHGELTGLMLIHAYHASRGDTARDTIIIPDSAHGTNPASSTAAGFRVREVKSDADGNIDLDALRGLMDNRVAGLMLTNPNTLGLFDPHIREICDIIHGAGGLAYYDGANLNAVVGICRPGDMGFDVVHVNLHKTFATPHGGGGPGSGPVGVKKFLEPFLPAPLVTCTDGRYSLDSDRPQSIGRMRSFHGNFGVIVRAYAYILSMGAEGLPEVARAAVLGANYVRARLQDVYELPYKRSCMHEVVLSGERQKKQGASTLDIAKRLIDYGYHPPTVYFPLIVHEALMIEPTETESKETLDAFIEAMRQIAQEAGENPAPLLEAPHGTPVTRLDEARAAREPVLTWAQFTQK